MLKPRPVLFKILCAVFALWMLALLVMYFLTVYPLRHPRENPKPETRMTNQTRMTKSEAVFIRSFWF